MSSGGKGSNTVHPVPPTTAAESSGHQSSQYPPQYPSPGNPPPPAYPGMQSQPQQQQQYPPQQQQYPQHQQQQQYPPQQQQYPQHQQQQQYPPQQPMYNVPPGQQHQQPTVVIQPAVNIINTGMPRFNQSPVWLVCPHCQANVQTTVYYKVGGFTFLIAGALLFFGLWLGCCLIPFCLNSCKDVEHLCPNCRRMVGKYNRL